MSNVKLKAKDEDTSSIFVIDTEYKVGKDGHVSVAPEHVQIALDTLKFELAKEENKTVKK